MVNDQLPEVGIRSREKVINKREELTPYETVQTSEFVIFLYTRALDKTGQE